MKKQFLILILLLFIPSTTFSAILRFEWQPYAATADMLMIWNINNDGSRTLVKGGIDPATTETTAEFLGENCGNFIMTAMYNSIESLAPAAVTPWCPDITLPPVEARPGQVIMLQIELVE